MAYGRRSPTAFDLASQRSPAKQRDLQKRLRNDRNGNGVGNALRGHVTLTFTLAWSPEHRYYWGLLIPCTTFAVNASSGFYFI